MVENTPDPNAVGATLLDQVSQELMPKRAVVQRPPEHRLDRRIGIQNVTRRPDDQDSDIEASQSLLAESNHRFEFVVLVSECFGEISPRTMG